MIQERKKLCLFTAINFTVGIIIGIVLFYGQQRTNPTVFEGSYEFDTALEIMDFFRASWLNLLWLFSIFIAHNILPLVSMHPIMLLRGTMSGFSLMYILTYIGIKGAVVSVIGQCFSILPLLMFFSVEIARRHRHIQQGTREGIYLKKSEIFLLFFAAALCAGVEMIIFRALCLCLC